ncbi:hypothetical protein QX233_02315 [Chryseobacterium gambrini]|uniref:Uncharacterized protein n=1 Tax=Chryseobacterium gambrini TaxID=373672 RepID=A0AAJ1VJ42_9FLAO|nr:MULTISPECIES: hypothetical protein [Chryseobacterium]MDN4011286.1 hypothetical protein [Chryseobacterium gambrini]MDN4031057.1 hypothetical protein [Chryseobacterium gambrini]QWA38059.1 hypothetical protein KKI44_19535 [Chryseobacterium sp. ZHDP1]
MPETLIFFTALLGISNFHYFLFFRRENKQLKLKIYLTILFMITILASFYVIIITPDFFEYKGLENSLFLVLINFAVPGYFLMLFGINSLLENIPIIRGYFTFNVIFGILFLSSTMLYYFLMTLIMMILTLDYV